MSKLAKALTAAAGNAGGESVYVDDVFSTYLYDGNSPSSQTITNGIDLDGEGGMVWLKNRASGGSFTNNVVVDSERVNSQGYHKNLYTNLTDGQYDPPSLSSSSVYAFNSNGFSLGANINTNYNGSDNVSWTFRKQAGFFDVVTYTGTGVARTISHNLGSTPAVIIVKGLDIAENWIVYHTSLGATKYIQLNTTGAAGTYSAAWNNTAPTSTDFTVGTFNAVNESGYSYVAYLFADDDQSFGDNSDESIIKCGNFDGAANTEINLGWEPQWVLWKNADSTPSWGIIDNMRGWYTGENDAMLIPNLTNAEDLTQDVLELTSTGFIWKPSAAGNNYIYVAIRRPMKIPEAATEVFNPIAVTTTTPTTSYTVGFPADLLMQGFRTLGISARTSTRMLGTSPYLETQNTGGESFGFGSQWDLQDDYAQAAGVSTTVISWFFKRATGFFDVVTYTGDGTADRPVAHNLGVVPTLRITKSRTSGGYASWWVYYIDSGGTQTRATLTQSPFYSNTDVVSTAQYIYPDVNVTNASGATYVTYLFASLDGISKVSTYTGNGGSADINVDCGFASGARFVLIKSKTESTNWLVWDSARGIVAGNDPYLQLNSTATEVTTNDYIDPYSAGFTVTTNAPTSGTYSLNASGVEYVFLAIA